MFSLADRKNYLGKTFIFGGYPLRTKVKGEPRLVCRGDIFKTKTINQSTIYIEIIDWSEPNKFSYIEYRWNPDEAEPGYPDRTDFAFRIHPEGIMVEIMRREQSDFRPSLRQKLRGTRNMSAWAAGRLTHIIAGDGAGFDLKDGESLSVSDYTVKRMDSMRENFAELPMMSR